MTNKSALGIVCNFCNIISQLVSNPGLYHFNFPSPDLLENLTWFICPLLGPTWGKLKRERGKIPNSFVGLKIKLVSFRFAWSLTLPMHYTCDCCPINRYIRGFYRGAHYVMKEFGHRVSPIFKYELFDFWAQQRLIIQCTSNKGETCLKYRQIN